MSTVGEALFIVFVVVLLAGVLMIPTKKSDKDVCLEKHPICFETTDGWKEYHAEK